MLLRMCFNVILYLFLVFSVANDFCRSFWMSSFQEGYHPQPAHSLPTITHISLFKRETLWLTQCDTFKGHLWSYKNVWELCSKKNVHEKFTYRSGYRQAAIDPPRAEPDHTTSESLDPLLLILQTQNDWNHLVLPFCSRKLSTKAQCFARLCCALKIWNAGAVSRLMMLETGWDVARKEDGVLCYYCCCRIKQRNTWWAIMEWKFCDKLQ